MSCSFQHIFISSLVDAIKEFCKIHADENEIKDNSKVQGKEYFSILHQAACMHLSHNPL